MQNSIWKYPRRRSFRNRTHHASDWNWWNLSTVSFIELHSLMNFIFDLKFNPYVQSSSSCRYVRLQICMQMNIYVLMQVFYNFPLMNVYCSRTDAVYSYSTCKRCKSAPLKASQLKTIQINFPWSVGHYHNHSWPNSSVRTEQ